MLVSTKGRYAIRVLLHLAAKPNSRQPIKDIAEEEGISAKYIEQIMILLKNTGMVNSTRGPNGGYMLVPHPSDITIGDIIRATEGDILISCNADTCDKIEGCKSHKLWKMVNDSINNVIDTVTLEDMVQW